MYKRTIWQDHVEGIQEGTDLNADNFNNIEAGTLEANALAALNAAYRRYEHDVVKDMEVYTTPMSIVLNGEKDTNVPIPPRNNTNYRVIPVILSANVEGSGTPAVVIGIKSLDHFEARLSQSVDGEVSAYFYVSGGMI